MIFAVIYFFLFAHMCTVQFCRDYIKYDYVIVLVAIGVCACEFSNFLSLIFSMGYFYVLNKLYFRTVLGLQ